MSITDFDSEIFHEPSCYLIAATGHSADIRLDGFQQTQVRLVGTKGCSLVGLEHLDPKY